jgi:hypothetical protein
MGKAVGGSGLRGFSETGVGVRGHSQNGPGVQGESDNDSGVRGESVGQYGVYGTGSTGGFFEGANEGVRGRADTGDGVVGTTNAAGKSGVVGVHGANGNGVYGSAGSGGWAGWFDGRIKVTDVVISGADCAEEFDVAEALQIEPGTVMVVEEEGILQPCRQAYDKRVAGVISGGGDYKPGIVLDKQPSNNNRMAVALVGKVYCKVDARYAPVQVGDLLTTSPYPGHAMKVDDPSKAFGSVIGKALRPLEADQGLIPILIALQ